MRGDDVWGDVHTMPNGSTIGTGLVGDLYYNRVDMTVAPLYIKYSRATYIDYLPPITPYYVGIYTPHIDNSENYNFKAFLSMFSTELEVCILVLAFFIAGLKLFLLYMHGSIRICIDIVAFLWTSFIANFGGKPTSTLIDSKQSYRILIFSSLIGGFVIWVAFRSRLTAELSVIIKKYPFTDMESFAETDWR